MKKCSIILMILLLIFLFGCGGDNTYNLGNTTTTNFLGNNTTISEQKLPLKLPYPNDFIFLDRHDKEAYPIFTYDNVSFNETLGELCFDYVINVFKGSVYTPWLRVEIEGKDLNIGGETILLFRNLENDLLSGRVCKCGLNTNRQYDVTVDVMQKTHEPDYRFDLFDFQAPTNDKVYKLLVKTTSNSKEMEWHVFDEDSFLDEATLKITNLDTNTVEFEQTYYDITNYVRFVYNFDIEGEFIRGDMYRMEILVSGHNGKEQLTSYCIFEVEDIIK